MVDSEAALVTEEDDRLIEELHNLKSQRSPRRVRADNAMRILEQTKSHRVRNAAALALADMRAPGAKDALIRLPKRPDTIRARGTLIYALDELGADVPLPVLADIILNETYEAREEAVGLVAQDRIACSDRELNSARKRFEAALGSADEERSQAIRRALGYLQEHGTAA
jgi:HEAT repeat protein